MAIPRRSPWTSTWIPDKVRCTCSRRAMVPMLYSPSGVTSSELRFCVTASTRLSEWACARSIVRKVPGRPTAIGMVTPGKSTKSRSGRTGKIRGSDMVLLPYGPGRARFGRATEPRCSTITKYFRVTPACSSKQHFRSNKFHVKYRRYPAIQAQELPATSARKARSRLASSSRTLRNASSCASSLPLAAAGSGKLQCHLRAGPGKVGQACAAWSQTVIT
jgi:hypothetical protein